MTASPGYLTDILRPQIKSINFIRRTPSFSLLCFGSVQLRQVLRNRDLKSLTPTNRPISQRPKQNGQKHWPRIIHFFARNRHLHRERHPDNHKNEIGETEDINGYAPVAHRPRPHLNILFDLLEHKEKDRAEVRDVEGYSS